MPRRDLFAVTASLAGMALAHWTISIVPGLPELEPGADTRTFVGLLWGVEAALVGAILVAMFFAFSTIQGFNPTRAAISGLVAELHLRPLLNFFLATLLGTGLTFLMLLPSPWDWPIQADSLWVLPVLDFFILTFALIATAVSVLSVLRFVHPSAIRELTEATVRKLARDVTHWEIEVKREEEKEPHQLQFLEPGEEPKEQPTKKPSRLASKYVHKRSLAELLDETKDHAMRALVGDDYRPLEDHLSLMQACIEEFGEVAGPHENQRHWEEMSYPRFEGSFLDSRFCQDRPLDDFFDLLSEAVLRRASKSTQALTWFPFQVWRSGLACENHGVARAGLRTGSVGLSILIRSGWEEGIETWARYWVESPVGPDEYLQRLRSELKADSSKEDTLHHLQGALEVHSALFQNAAIAVLLMRGSKTAGDLVVCHANKYKMLWRVDDPAFGFTEEARKMVGQYMAHQTEGVVYLTGLVAAQHYRHRQDERLLTLLLAVLEETCDRESALQVIATEPSDPPWLSAAMSITDEYPHYDDDPGDIGDIQAWCAVLLFPLAFKNPAAIGVETLGKYFERRPRAAYVLKRFLEHPDIWGKWVGDAWVTEYTKISEAEGGRPSDRVKR